MRNEKLVFYILIFGILGFTVAAEKNHPRLQRYLENRMRRMCDLKYESSSKNLVNYLRSLTTMNQFEAKPYLESDNRVSVGISHETTKVLPKLFCNDGNEGLADSRTTVQDCFARAFRASKLVATAASGSKTLPEGNECTNIDKYRRWSVKVLEKCERVVAQVVDSLFNLLERNTSCKDSLDDGTKKDMQNDSSIRNTEGTVIKNTASKSDQESNLIHGGGPRSTRARCPLLMKRTIPRSFGAVLLSLQTAVNIFSIIILIIKTVRAFLMGIPTVFG